MSNLGILHMIFEPILIYTAHFIHHLEVCPCFLKWDTLYIFPGRVSDAQQAMKLQKKMTKTFGISTAANCLMIVIPGVIGDFGMVLFE